MPLNLTPASKNSLVLNYTFLIDHVTGLLVSNNSGPLSIIDPSGNSNGPYLPNAFNMTDDLFKDSSTPSPVSYLNPNSPITACLLAGIRSV